MEFIRCPVVRHETFGEGIVLDQRHHGHEYLIRFSETLKLWIEKSRLTFLEDNKQLIIKESSDEEAHTACIPEPCIEPKAASLKEARSVIEAFRLGIVPISGIREWTVGRAAELQKVREWLQDESSGTMVIRGEYGSGKSHLIEYLHASGFELNYAVSMVAIDPCDAQPGFPKRVYRHLMKNLRFPYQGQYFNVCEILTLIGRESQENPLPDHRFLGKVLQKIIKNKDTQEMWDWIEGQETPYAEIATLHDHTTAANIYCNILSGLGMLIVRKLGLKGILLMFDEAETSRTYRYSYEWTRALNFFNALSMVANDEPTLEDEKVVRGTSYYYGEKTGLIYSGFLPIPYIYQLPSFLKVAFAFTPDYTLSLYEDHNIYEIALDALSPREMESLFNRFTKLYEGAYQVKLPKGLRDFLFERVKHNSYYSTRRFIKAMVESLDFFRFYPSENPAILFSHVPPAIIS